MTWHAFALTALFFAPVGIALPITRERIQARPMLAIGAAIFAALAGLAQAIGLWRSVFVNPGLTPCACRPVRHQ